MNAGLTCILDTVVVVIVPDVVSQAVGGDTLFCETKIKTMVVGAGERDISRKNAGIRMTARCYTVAVVQVGNCPFTGIGNRQYIGTQRCLLVGTADIRYPYRVCHPRYKLCNIVIPTCNIGTIGIIREDIAALCIGRNGTDNRTAGIEELYHHAGDTCLIGILYTISVCIEPNPVAQFNRCTVCQYLNIT